MSENEQKEGVYTTRVTGDMVDELDEYVDNQEKSKSAALRDLLDLGLQADRAGAVPAELQDEIEELEQHSEEQQQEISELREAKLAGGLVTAGVLVIFVAAGSPALAFEALASIPRQIVNFIYFIGAVLIFAGLTGWSLLLVRPYLGPKYTRLKQRFFTD